MTDDLLMFIGDLLRAVPRPVNTMGRPVKKPSKRRRAKAKAARKAAQVFTRTDWDGQAQPDLKVTKTRL